MPTREDERLEYLRQKLDQLHQLSTSWNNLRHHELELARQLQARAAEEMKRAERLEQAGLFEEAAEASRRQSELLTDAENLMLAAEQALNKQAEAENQQDFGENDGQSYPANRRSPR